MNTNRFTLLIAAAATAFAMTAGAAEPATITKDEAKSLKAQSEGQYKARKNVAEANEDLNRADCKSALEGIQMDRLLLWRRYAQTPTADTYTPERKHRMSNNAA